MSKNSKINNDEISLIDYVETIWNGKWKIFLIVIISVLFFFAHNSTLKKNFTAITEVNTISTLEQNNSLTFNYPTFDIKDKSEATFENIISQFSFELKKDQLLEHFIEVLNEKSLFEKGIHKFRLLDANQYENEQSYEEAIIKLASSIKILSPLKNEKLKKKGRYEQQYYSVEFKYDNKEKWFKVLEYVEESANKLVKKNLELRYKKTISNLKKKKKFNLEDVSIKINNAINDYDRNMSDRLSYLLEQSQIARVLGIKKNTIEVQKFGSQNTLLSNIKTENPFYLRGYVAIEKEVLLIRSRTSKIPFVPGLKELEKKQRVFIQDKTIERLENFFVASLLDDRDKFNAASINVLATEFISPKNTQRLFLVIAFGLIIGIFYVFISNLVLFQKSSKKK